MRTPDTTPPTIIFIEAESTEETSITVTLQLDEPGTAYCKVYVDTAYGGTPPTTWPFMDDQEEAGISPEEEINLEEAEISLEILETPPMVAAMTKEAAADPLEAPIRLLPGHCSNGILVAPCHRLSEI